MSITATVPKDRSSPGGDQRLARISRTTRVLQRPEFGALMGAVAVFLDFHVPGRHPQSSVAHPDGHRRLDRAVGVLRDHGCPRGPADDRRGVRPVYRGYDRRHRHSDGPAHRQAALERVGRHRRDPRLCHHRRPGQRLGRGQDEAAQLHRHAGDVLCAPGRQHWLCPARQPGQHQRGPDGYELSRSRQRQSGLREQLCPQQFTAWGLSNGRALVHRRHRPGHLDPHPHDVRQLDIRFRRRPCCRPQHRRPRQPDEVLLFLGTSLCAAVVGIISLTAASSAVSEQGVGYEFYYIIAAVVGGCLLSGGYGSALGLRWGRASSAWLSKV